VEEAGQEAGLVPATVLAALIAALVATGIAVRRSAAFVCRGPGHSRRARSAAGVCSAGSRPGPGRPGRIAHRVRHVPHLRTHTSYGTHTSTCFFIVHGTISVTV